MLNILNNNPVDEKNKYEIFNEYGKGTVIVGGSSDWSDDILLTENGQMLRYGTYTNGSVDPLGRTAMEGFNVLLGD